MKVLLVAAEAVPFVKSGGLGDVVGSLPKALRRLGIEASVILPRYQSIAPEYQTAMKLHQELIVPVGWRRQYCGIYMLEYDGVPFYFLENNYYFQRPYMYGFFDEAERYAFFGRSVLEALPFLPAMPDVLHCHDWHTGMISPLLTAHFRSWPLYQSVRTLFTVHNLKYQGVFDKQIIGDVLDLGWEYFNPAGVEFYDQVSFMKGGLVFSDQISTVSETYAAEIQTAFFGERLEGVIANRRQDLTGIVNGIDYESYNPETDQRIYCRYNAQASQKRDNKVKLQESLGLPVDADKPLLAIVSRLVSQKGLDLIARVLPEILALNLQLVVLGTGEERYEGLFRHAAWQYPDQVSANIFFDETMARRIYAAADVLLMPSLYEPCGIAQLIAMRYGCLPLTRETGGLRDTVTGFNEYTGEGNGFSFTNYNAHDMLFTIERALGLYGQQALWSRIVQNAMRADFSWHNSAVQYGSLYEQLNG